jgi:deoxyribose-phosphate aldolase
MEISDQQIRPPLNTYEDLASRIDHSLLRPELTQEEVERGCRLAKELNVACVIVRPSDVDLAVQWMREGGVVVGSVAGFPHGSSTTASKLYEIQDLVRRGAKEIDMVINIGKMLSRCFRDVETELYQAAALCHQNEVIFKVILENAYLPEDLKVIACRICSKAGADFVKTSTGFAPSGYRPEDVRLMRKSCHPNVKIKAAGGIRNLTQAIEAYSFGADRLGMTATTTILAEWKRYLANVRS